MIKAEAKEVTEERLSQLATEIRIYSTNMLINIIEIGRRFEEAKSLCSHGEFGKWCKECTSYEQSMVENYIKIYREYGGGQMNLGGDFTNSQSIAALGVTKLLELAKLPADEREDFVEKNNITPDTTVKELKEKIKALESENESLIEKSKAEIHLKECRLAELEEEAKIADKEAKENEAVIEELKNKILELENMPAAEANSDELADMIKSAENEELEKLKSELEKITDENKKLKDKQKGVNDEIKKLKTEAQEHAAKDRERQKELAEAKAEITRLKKAAELSGDKSIAKIEILFSSVQKDITELAELITASGKTELLPKVKGVIEGLLCKK